MFTKLAADALGLSDIGSVISPQDYDKTEADDYICHEIGERIIFLIKSKSDEYCFTNLGLIHVDGNSAISKKRALRRYDYEFNIITKAEIETAGTIDLDIELKLKIGNVDFSIDVHKKYIEQLKDLYKALHQISVIQRTGQERYKLAAQGIEAAARSVEGGKSQTPAFESFAEITKFTYDWLENKRLECHRRDFGEVFELYINN